MLNAIFQQSHWIIKYVAVGKSQLHLQVCATIDDFTNIACFKELDVIKVDSFTPPKNPNTTERSAFHTGR